MDSRTTRPPANQWPPKRHEQQGEAAVERQGAQQRQAECPSHPVIFVTRVGVCIGRPKAGKSKPAEPR